MSSLKGLMDSNSQVVDAKARLAKIDAAKLLVETMRSSIEASASSPQPGAAGYTQVEVLKELGSQLTKILATIK